MMISTIIQVTCGNFERNALEEISIIQQNVYAEELKLFPCLINQHQHNLKQGYFLLVAMQRVRDNELFTSSA